jgi:hypothetical protein
MSVGLALSANALSGLRTEVREITKSKDSIDVAQLQFVGLAKIEQAYGVRWP